jgi:UDP-N-acetylglucosamine acyltransferase
MTDIHKTALVEEGAELGKNVKVGPFSIVGPQVQLGDGVEVKSHVVIGGQTEIGANSIIYPFSAIGLPPQDLKYCGEESQLLVGPNTIIREHVTMNPGTEGGGLVTRTGSNGLFMIGAHIAHDCQIGDHVILVNNVTLGGHVVVGDHAILGGLSAVHQFVRIGAHAMVGGMSGVENDVIPYGSVTGNRAHLMGLNIVGLKRRNFERATIHDLRNAYRSLFAEEGTLQERLEDVAELFSENPYVMEIVEFVRAATSRAICQPKLDRAA